MLKTVSAALLGLTALGYGALHAAPDNTLGPALMSATVNSAGSISKASGVATTGNVKSGMGTYDVPFDRDLENCTCSATFGGTHNLTNITQQNHISSGCPFNINANGNRNVRIRTYVNGALSDQMFQLLVFCPK